jgi:hypothetical protein
MIRKILNLNLVKIQERSNQETLYYSTYGVTAITLGIIGISDEWFRTKIKFEVDNQLLNYANVINTQTTTPPEQTDDKEKLLYSIHQYTECDHFEKLEKVSFYFILSNFGLKWVYIQKSNFLLLNPAYCIQQ